MMTREEAEKIVANELGVAIDGFTSMDQKNGIDIPTFFKVDANSVEIDWDNVECFAQEVAIRTLIAFSDKENWVSNWQAKGGLAAHVGLSDEQTMRVG